MASAYPTKADLQAPSCVVPRTSHATIFSSYKIMNLNYSPFICTAIDYQTFFFFGDLIGYTIGARWGTKAM